MYHIVHLKNVSILAEDWLSSYVFEQGALGMSESLKYEPKPGTDEVQSLISEFRDLDIYFESTPAPQFFELLRLRFPEIEISTLKKENEDWMEGWKEHFKAFELVGGHYVVPSWLEAPKEAQKVLSIDPGMAFGTGTHETTSLMSKALYELVPEGRGKSLLDVGTGTGILAILGSMMGFENVVATDTDVESQRVANENFGLNKTSVQMDHRQIDQLNEQFDVVLANIIEGVLLLLREDLFKKVKPQGWLLLSGILAENKSEFVSQFELPKGAQWVHERQDGEWICLGAKWP
ncbi:MAG: 50S ribosomal protein L11 methyltransferase [Bdellovibrionales bacterium]|nr:50S ribosomal protein L11 methyltransferase [Bdellovibrionales bacterium]